MNRERWIGLAAVLLIVGGFLVLRGRGPGQLGDEGLAGESEEERMSEFAERMGVVLPEDVDKTDLIDVAGGNGRGLATRKYEEGSFEHSVLAALPDPESGSWYEGWLVRGEPFEVIYTGKMRQAKGGWVVDFFSGEDLSDHNQVVVTLEKVDDRQPETHILEGSF